ADRSERERGHAPPCSGPDRPSGHPASPVSVVSRLGSRPGGDYRRRLLEGVGAASAAVTQATAGVAAATAARDLVPEDAENARIRAADAEVEIARAALSGARSQLGAARAALTVACRAGDAAAADVERARAVVTGLEAARAKLTLTAPIDGAVAWLSVVRAEQVLPGVPLLRIADTSAWQFETTDLAQDGAVRVRVGNSARIAFDALPGVEIAGRVTSIGGLGVDRQGDVVVPVTIEPDEAMPAGIVWNMTVSVTIRPAD
ncbi:MAG: HlyD family efflux transporter periplasmic adaptor subunit, partial [Chloroflexi bacterium]|nr:HlyD family efflux transporter periplasmic adaptor subunit [Chloroflexota bacterium]